MTISPFRYPGAKTKLLPIINEYLNPLLQKSSQFTDVFVGGGSVLLDVASRFPKMELFINDKDPWIAAFWSVASSSDKYKLEELFSLMSQPVTIEHFYKLRESHPTTDVERAYMSIFFNRCCFSGISTSGPIGGKEQLSKYKVDCRYNFKKLKNKILKCNQLLVNRIFVESQDFSQYEPLVKNEMVAYIDPPYWKQGKSLYFEFMNEKEHANLATLLSDRSNWVLSYDDVPEIRNLYSKNNIIDLAARYSINGKKTQWSNKNELLVVS
jgi:DNA adenine methylase